MKYMSLVLVLILAIGVINCFAKDKGKDIVVENGKEVSFNYTLTVDNEVVDSSQGKEPLNYVHGEGKIIPGLARQLEGLHVGDEKNITVQPEEAYGQVNPDALREVPRSQLPADIEPRADMPLQVRTAEGGVFPVKIAEVKEDSVIVDFNHPLAGKVLNFQIEIVSIK